MTLPQEHPEALVERDWIMVPREPTEAMLKAGARDCFKIMPPMTMRSIWSAMLAAAPSSPQDARIAELEAENARLRAGLVTIAEAVIERQDGNGTTVENDPCFDAQGYAGQVLSTTKGEGR